LSTPGYTVYSPRIEAFLFRALSYSTATKFDGSTVSGRTLGISFVAIFMFCRERYSCFVAKDLYLLLQSTYFVVHLLSKFDGSTVSGITLGTFCAKDLHLLSQSTSSVAKVLHLLSKFWWIDSLRKNIFCRKRSILLFLKSIKPSATPTFFLQSFQL
jgi:hypothetical protein